MFGKKVYKQSRFNFGNIFYQGITPSSTKPENTSLRNEDNREIVLDVVKQDGLAIRHALETFKNDFDIVFAAVSQNGKALSNVSVNFRKNRKIVLTAVTQDGLALQDADESLRSDPDIVLAAVIQNGMALQHTSGMLRSDPHIVGIAVKQNGQAFQYASDTLKNDKAFMLNMTKQSGEAFFYSTSSGGHNQQLRQQLTHEMELAKKQEDFSEASDAAKRLIAKSRLEDTTNTLFRINRSKSEFSNKSPEKSLYIPQYFCCPITQKIMLDPVIAMDGCTYEREAIESKLRTSQVTGNTMESSLVVPNNNLRALINEFRLKNQDSIEKAYMSQTIQKELLALCSGEKSINVVKWKGILEKKSELLYTPLDENNITLLEHLCKQKKEMVVAYLTELCTILKSDDWNHLLKIYPFETWFKWLAEAYDRAELLAETPSLLKHLQEELGFYFSPEIWALYALEEQHIELFKLAINHIKEVNEVIDGKGNTLLHLAAAKGHFDLVQYLISKGADLKKRNLDGLKPQTLAKENGHQSTADLLAFTKIAPALERMGIFSALQQVGSLRSEVQMLQNTVKDLSASKIAPTQPAT